MVPNAVQKEFVTFLAFGEIILRVINHPVRADVPTPPAAPLIKTFCPASIRPLSRRPCNAVNAATGADAACSNVTFSGFLLTPT
jgi:hypothetical protein